MRYGGTEELLCQKMIELMNQKSFMEISVTELVKYAQVGRSTFYVYFDSVFDVVQRIEDQFIEGMNRRISLLDTSTNGRYSDTTLASLSYIQDNLDVFCALCGPNGDPSFEARIKSTFFGRFKTRMRSGKNLSESELQLIWEYQAGGRWGMFKWWAFHQSEIGLSEMAEIVTRTNKNVLNLFHTN